MILPFLREAVRQSRESSLKEGPSTWTMPEKLSAESAADFEYWTNGIIQKMRRSKALTNRECSKLENKYISYSIQMVDRGSTHTSGRGLLESRSKHLARLLNTWDGKTLNLKTRMSQLPSFRNKSTRGKRLVSPRNRKKPRKLRGFFVKMTACRPISNRCDERSVL